MPYKSYKKRFYKRYGRKGKFTKYTTYKNRGSKAQAGQIYSLSKRITSIERKTRPEYLQHEAYISSSTVNPSSLWVDNRLNLLQIKENSTKYLVQDEGTIHGSAIRMIKLIVWGSITRIPKQYELEKSTVDPDNYIINPLPRDNPILVRILVGLLPRASDSVPVTSEIFQTDGQFTVDNFKAPLLKGAGQVINIKKYKKYQISLTNQMTKTFKFTIPLYGAICRKVVGNAFPYHTPLLFTSVLNNTYSDDLDVNSVSLSLNAKLIYTDA